VERKILYILPHFEERMWGGTRLITEFGYKTDIHPIGEVYNVVALKNRADCRIRDSTMTLSDLYEETPEFFDCDTKELPLRVNILDPVADLSVQLHPGDEYALQHDYSRGKPEAWVILDTPPGGYIEFGHNALNKEEFISLTNAKKFGKLCRYISAKKNWFIDIPAGTLHAIGKGVLTYNISRNADITYRLYDYDRINPSTGKMRELTIQQVIDNVVIPDNKKDFIWFSPKSVNGCEITEYWDEPGLYTLKRIKVSTNGTYIQERFLFITVVNGSGTINNQVLKKGDTVFIPDNFGNLNFQGDLDMFLATYSKAQK
jgi:mannose-6-phosphate isomerase